MKPLHITIIGGGFCGTMTAINLMQQHRYPLHIHLINKGYPLAKGVAYAPYSSSLLLNVPNGKISAFPDMPDHFSQWLKTQPDFSGQPDDELAGDFSPREKYGYYLTHLWQEALNQKDSDIAVTVYDDNAYDMVEDGGQFYIYLKNHPVLTADVVVLATGNVRPRRPAGIPLSFKEDKQYYGNPWKRNSIENFGPAGDILIIGNGLTMADTVLGLAENEFKGKIYTVSPHGYNLNRSKENKAAYTGMDLQEVLNDGTDLESLLKNFNKHRKIAESLNQSAYTLVDSFRPHVQKIWQSLNWAEKQQFIKYLRHLWGSTRHRLPAKIHDFIAGMYANERLFTYKGVINNIGEQDGLLNVTLNCGGILKDLTVQRIINCTGPESNLKLSANELLRNLEKNRLVSPDDLNMGIQANPADGSVIAPDGKHRPGLYVIGTNLKGILWESTAVPELRLQAKKLAAHLIEKYDTRVLS